LGWEIFKSYEFNLYKGLSFYYHGKALISKLPNIDEPDEYLKKIKGSKNFFANAVIYVDKTSNAKEFKNVKLFFPVCYNIYSALYEYNLCFLNLDKKRFDEIHKYLNEASKKVALIDTENVKEIIKLIDKFTETLEIRLNQIEMEKKKLDLVKKGDRDGREAKYETYINKSKKEFEKNIVEVDNFISEMEAPIFKKIAEIEKESLRRLEFKEDKEKLLAEEYFKSFPRKILEILTISFTIAGVIWGIIYAILVEIKYPTALRESLIMFCITFLIISIFSAIKK